MSQEVMMRPIFINRTQLRELLSTTGTPISHQAIKKWEEEGKVPKSTKMGNTAVYSIEELSAKIKEPQENIWRFLNDLNRNQQ